MNDVKKAVMTNWRWVMCAMLFFATTVNYMDRQVLSLTWKEFIQPEFHWTNAQYGDITGYFSIAYAIFCLFAGKFIDWMGTKKGYLIAIVVWSIGAVMHAGCGVATTWLVDGVSDKVGLINAVGETASAISMVSVYLFLACRLILGLGEAGNFPAAIKVTAEYFPKKDRAFGTSIFNAGASVGALAAPATIPLLAKAMGWEWAFIIIGALGFIWAGIWVFVYDKPEKSKHVNEAELAYVNQDEANEKEKDTTKDEKTIAMLPHAWAYFAAGIAVLVGAAFMTNVFLTIGGFALALILLNMPFLNYYKYRQTRSFAFGKFMTDGVWWFFLFWTPAYFQDQFGIKASDPQGVALIFTLYAIVTVVSIFGGYLPKIFVEKKGMEPYAGRMRAMLIFAFFPLVALAAQPLGGVWGPWAVAIIIGIVGAAHQSWSANIFSTVGDMFPKSAIATVTGVGAMAGGIGSFIINKCSGILFDHSAGAFHFGNKDYIMNAEGLKEAFDLKLEAGSSAADYANAVVAHGGEVIRQPMEALGFSGTPAGYMIVFCICAVAYLIGWIVMKSLVPKHKPVVVK